jgi:hypothetical protein
VNAKVRREEKRRKKRKGAKAQGRKEEDAVAVAGRSYREVVDSSQ